MIKKSWSTPMPNRLDKVMVSIRFHPDTLLHVNLIKLPPVENKMNIDDAVKIGLAEPHLAIGYMDYYELHDLITHLSNIRDTLPIYEDGHEAT